jgi:hypothetical protein
MGSSSSHHFPMGFTQSGYTYRIHNSRCGLLLASHVCSNYSGPFNHQFNYNPTLAGDELVSISIFSGVAFAF